MNMRFYLTAHCTGNLKTCSRFKLQALVTIFLKDCEITKMHRNHVLIYCMMGG